MNQGNSQSFGIGAVARRTGLSTSNIRMWEARYSAVEPQRTPTNRRLYCARDVERLTVLRNLTQRGHAIGNIAHLDLEDLKTCLDEEVATPATPQHRVLVVGESLERVVRAGTIPGQQLVGSFPDLSGVTSSKEIPESDFVLIETETLFPETIASVRELIQSTKASHNILIYHFTTSRTATALAKAIPGLTLLVAPVSDAQLRRECLLRFQALQDGGAVLPTDSGPLPERLYTQHQLARLAQLTTTVDCECPQHLAGLLKSLSAFEKYSGECEDRNPKDAVLHTFLHRTTAKARRSLEEALQHVLQSEGISLSP